MVTANVCCLILFWRSGMVDASMFQHCVSNFRRWFVITILLFFSHVVDTVTVNRSCCWTVRMIKMMIDLADFYVFYELLLYFLCFGTWIFPRKTVKLWCDGSQPNPPPRYVRTITSKYRSELLDWIVEKSLGAFWFGTDAHHVEGAYTNLHKVITKTHTWYYG